MPLDPKLFQMGAKTWRDPVSHKKFVEEEKAKLSANKKKKDEEAFVKEVEAERSNLMREKVAQTGRLLVEKKQDDYLAKLKADVARLEAKQGGKSLDPTTAIVKYDKDRAANEAKEREEAVGKEVKLTALEMIKVQEKELEEKRKKQEKEINELADRRRRELLDYKHSLGLLSPSSSHRRPPHRKRFPGRPLALHEDPEFLKLSAEDRALLETLSPDTRAREFGFGPYEEDEVEYDPELQARFEKLGVGTSKLAEKGIGQLTEKKLLEKLSKFICTEHSNVPGLLHHFPPLALTLPLEVLTPAAYDNPQDRRTVEQILRESALALREDLAKTAILQHGANALLEFRCEGPFELQDEGVKQQGFVSELIAQGIPARVDPALAHGHGQKRGKNVRFAGGGGGHKRQHTFGGDGLFGGGGAGGGWEDSGWGGGGGDWDGPLFGQGEGAGGWGGNGGWGLEGVPGGWGGNDAVAGGWGGNVGGGGGWGGNAGGWGGNAAHQQGGNPWSWDADSGGAAHNGWDGGGGGWGGQGGGAVGGWGETNAGGGWNGAGGGGGWATGGGGGGGGWGGNEGGGWGGNSGGMARDQGAVWQGLGWGGRKDSRPKGPDLPPDMKNLPFGAQMYIKKVRQQQEREAREMAAAAAAGVQPPLQPNVPVQPAQPQPAGEDPALFGNAFPRQPFPFSPNPAAVPSFSPHAIPQPAAATPGAPAVDPFLAQAGVAGPSQTAAAAAAGPTFLGGLQDRLKAQLGAQQPTVDPDHGGQVAGGWGGNEVGGAAAAVEWQAAPAAPGWGGGGQPLGAAPMKDLKGGHSW
ncbi:hypothetical protein JCM6882_001379 [Rhodosporidiobolus microsporus]